MSILSNIGRELGRAVTNVGNAVGRVGSTVAQVSRVAAPLAASLVPGGNLIRTVAGLVAQPRSPAPITQVAAPLAPLQPPALSLPATVSPATSLAPSIAGPIGTAVSGIIGAFAPQIGSGIIRTLTPSSGGGSCGCNHSSGRDPCTRQRMSSQPAPLATFFGGCCPPGRTLRRKPMGRDICIRTPRMNPFNPAALARADRRITQFARRASPMLRDLGFQVSRTRKPTIKAGKRKRR